MKNKTILLILVISVSIFTIGTSFASEANVQFFTGLDSSSGINELEKRNFSEYDTSPLNMNHGCGSENPYDIWTDGSLLKDWMENKNNWFEIFEIDPNTNQITNFPKFPIGYEFKGGGSCSGNKYSNFYESLFSLSNETKEKFLEENNVKFEASKLENTGNNYIKSVTESIKYWKTVKTKVNTYKYYKINKKTIFKDGSTNTTTSIKKQILKTYNKKTSINLKSKNWKKGKYNNKYIIITKNPNQKQINKFKLNKANKDVKISKVITTSTKNNKNKKYYNTYKKPSNGKIFKTEKNKKIDEINVYYTIKKYEWINQ